MGEGGIALTDSNVDIARTLAGHLDRGAERPLSRQIADRMWLEVIGGTLDTGQRLPTVRQLAIDLGVHPKVVQRAYDELERLGVVTVRPGGTFVSLTVPDAEAREKVAQLEEACREALGRAEALGFSADDVMDMLAELRAARREPTDTS